MTERACPNCTSTPGRHACPLCHSKGRILLFFRCHYCGGTGSITCDMCYGKGTIP